MSERRWTLYCHRNKLNSKKYFGITSQKPEQRWMNGHGYEKHLPIGRAIRKYGWNAFDHIIIHKNLSEKEAKELERLYIAMYKTQFDNFGYNLTRGGDGVSGLRRDESYRQKVSEAMRGSNHPNWGKHLSEETKKKISVAHTGMPSPNKGVPLSEDHRKNISKAKYKPVAAYDDSGKLVYTFPSARHAAEALGVNFRNISLSIHGERKHCGGYQWRFA